MKILNYPASLFGEKKNTPIKVLVRDDFVYSELCRKQIKEALNFLLIELRKEFESKTPLVTCG